MKVALGCKKVMKLNLSNNELTEDSLSVVGDIVQHGGHLELKFCSLTSGKLDALKRSLGDKKMGKIDLEGNAISGDALSTVGFVLQDNGLVGLNYCSLTGSELQSLKTALGDKKVKELDLSKNKISDENLSAAGHVILNSGELNLDGCSTTSTGMQRLQTALGDKKLKRLNLSGNSLSKDILTVAGYIIQSDGHLELERCGYYPSELKYLKDALGDKKIQELNFSFNPRIAAAFSVVAHIVQNDGVLRLQGCQLTSSDLERLKKTLGGKKVSILEGGHKELSETNLPDIMRNIESNNNLDLREYSLKIGGFQLLKTELNDKKVKTVRLDGNPLSNDILSIVSQIVQNDGKLYMQDCSLPSSGLENLKASLGDKKLMGLYLWGNDNINQSLGVVGSIVADLGELGLGDCKVTTSGLKRLTNGLRTKQISYLNFAGNTINQEMASTVGKITKKSSIDRLRMVQCSLTDESLNNFLSEARGSKVSELMISSNTIDEEMAATVGKITKELSVVRLEMRNCSLTDEALNNFLYEAAGSELSFLNVSQNGLSQSAIEQIRQIISVEEINDLYQREVAGARPNLGVTQPLQAGIDQTRPSTSAEGADDTERKEVTKGIKKLSKTQKKCVIT